MSLPSVVLEYNKKAKSNKIAYLSDAKALFLKRFYSGSIGLNRILGGGAAYKRIQLYYGPKSAGKNATLNQMTAFNQRICRKCHKVLPEFWENGSDRHGVFLRYILGMDVCTCQKPEGKNFIFYDYEKTLSLDNEPKVVRIRLFKDKQTGKDVSENEYNEALIKMDELKESKGNKAEIAEIEAWINNLDISFEEHEQLGSSDYLRLCGVIPERLVVFAPEDLEEGIDSMRTMIKSKEIDCIIWDSLQAALPRYVGDRSAGDATMGVESKQNGLLMRQITAAYSPTDITDEAEAYLPAVFLTAQVRANLSAFHAPVSYSGGKAVEHFISAAIEFKRADYLRADGCVATKGDVYFGQQVALKAEKNKLNAPYAKTTFNYFFKASEQFPVGFIDYFDEITTIAIDNKIIQQGGGGNYSFKDTKIRGLDNLVLEIRNNPDLCKMIYDEVKSLI